MKPAPPAFGFQRFIHVAGESFPGLLGLWIALALIKFGNPVILDHQISPPANLLEGIYQSWPVAWGYGLFGLVILTGIATAMTARGVRPGADLHRRTQRDLRHSECTPPNRAFSPATRTSLQQLAPLLPLVCLAWLGWQVVSALQTVSSALTRATLPHFGVCCLCFLLGYLVLKIDGSRRWNALWLGMAGGWLVVVCLGWRQHFGGLAETREYFYSLPNWRDQSPELIAKVASNRIYSTLVYPNALAGVMLLFTPGLAFGIWERSQTQAMWLRAVLAGLPAIGAVGCLVWSGSKAGWLIATGLVAIGWRFLPGRKSRRLRRRPTLGFILLVSAALGGFWIRYGDYFAKGATSLSARGDYWKVAASNALARPILGSGPGTFMPVYRTGKPTAAEMTRLVHNDYLQQATDSGLIGGLLFLSLVGGVLVVGYHRDLSPTGFGVWLGVVGLAAQSWVEFGLYIPALAWPWFIAMGALSGSSRWRRTTSGKTVDKATSS